MKYIVFTLQEDTKYNIWLYENIQVQELENYQWMLTINNERQIYESIYDVIDALAVLGFHVTFRYPKDMYDPIDKCE